MLEFTGYLLSSTKDVLPHRPFRIKTYCVTGEWLYGTAGDSVVNMNLEKGERSPTKHRHSRSVIRDYRSCLPSSRLVSHGNVKSSSLKREGCAL
jgi:hypothetical protein